MLQLYKIINYTVLLSTKFSIFRVDKTTGNRFLFFQPCIFRYRNVNRLPRIIIILFQRDTYDIK